VKILTAEMKNKAKQFVLRAFALMENVWFKRIVTTLLVIYSIYFIINQFNALRETFTNLTINPLLLLLSSLILFISVLLSVFSWSNLIAAFDYVYPWIEIARAQMLSTLGKYIPGHIWNYSSKIYLSHKLGFPIKLSGMAVIIEMIITYLMAFCLLLIFIPTAIFPAINVRFIMIFRLLGVAIFILLIIFPFLPIKFLKNKLLFKMPINVVYVVLIRAIVWVLPSFAFILLILALGYATISLPMAISVITSSFLVGFLAIFVPDGLVVREATIIFFMRNILATTDATVISLVFRFQLVIIEFLTILMVVIVWKILKAQLKDNEFTQNDLKND